MASYAFAVPVLPGKTEALRRLGAEVSGPRRREFAEHERRLGLTREIIWLQHTPQGDMVVNYWEGADPAHAFQVLISSDSPFDRWFKDQLKEIHGIDFTQPLPPNELVFEWQAT